MAITVQAKQTDGTWGVRSAFTTENAKVRAGSMTAADLEALARATMSKWQQTSCDGKQLRVHNSDNDAKPERGGKLRFKTADDAIANLLADGFTKTDYDPHFPYMQAWADGDGMMARVGYDHNREHYYIEGARL